MDRQDGIIFIIATGKHGIENTLFYFMFNCLGLRFQLDTQAGIIQARQFDGVAQTALKCVPAIQLFA